MDNDFIGKTKGRLEVLGYYGENSFGHRLYTVKCHECAEDAELFGDATYQTTKAEFVKGRMKCGCSRSPRWSEEQMVVRLNRICEGKGIVFEGFDGEYKWAATSGYKVYCPESDYRWTVTLSNLIRNKCCPACKAKATSRHFRKPDEDMVESFRASGAFVEGTEFWRSTRENKDGYCRHWHVRCPKCPGVYEALAGELQKGCRPCACPVYGFKTDIPAHLYVLKVIDTEGKSSFTGYGITNRVGGRLKEHKRNLANVGLTVTDSKVFDMIGHTAASIEREITRHFPTHSQDVEGFRREATHARHYLDVIQFVQAAMLSNSDSPELLSQHNYLAPQLH